MKAVGEWLVLLTTPSLSSEKSRPLFMISTDQILSFSRWFFRAKFWECSAGCPFVSRRCSPRQSISKEIEGSVAPLVESDRVGILRAWTNLELLWLEKLKGPGQQGERTTRLRELI